MEYTPYEELECALQENDRLKFVYNFSVYNYIKNYNSFFGSNEMWINQIVRAQLQPKTKLVSHGNWCVTHPPQTFRPLPDKLGS